MLSPCVLFALTSVALALRVTSPQSNQVIDASERITITWIAEESDPDSISIDLTSHSAAGADSLFNLVQQYSTSRGEYSKYWQKAPSTEARSYQVIIRDSVSGDILDLSSTFGLARALGLYKAINKRDSGEGLKHDIADESTEETSEGSTNESTEEPATNTEEATNETTDEPRHATGTPTSTKITEALIPIVVVIVGICLGANAFWRRRRRAPSAIRQIKKEEPDDVEMARLTSADDTHGPGFDDVEHSHDSHDYIGWEQLPRSPLKLHIHFSADPDMDEVAGKADRFSGNRGVSRSENGPSSHSEMRTYD